VPVLYRMVLHCGDMQTAGMHFVAQKMFIGKDARDEVMTHALCMLMWGHLAQAALQLPGQGHHVCYLCASLVLSLL
jgi:hypothetical protein